MMALAVYCLAALLAAASVNGLVPLAPMAAPGFARAANGWTRRPSSRSTSLHMCICINCARVTNCKAYHFVETKHEQPHMNSDPTWEPRDGSPTIHVNVRSQRDGKDEIAKMWREHQAETELAEQKQQLEQQKGINDALHGETVYDLSPVTTVEYDVVACEDFLEDEGCWVVRI